MKPAARYPADPRAVFILSLCVITGLPMLFLHLEPGSISALIPHWAAFVWGFCLVFGAGLTLAGMSKDSIEGILAEQIGSVVVGCATVFYSATAIFAVGVSALWAAAIMLGWGLSCFWRWGQLQALIQKSFHIVEFIRKEDSGT